MRIEFFGAPGVGKSHARHLLLNSLYGEFKLASTCRSVATLEEHPEFYNSYVQAQRMYSEYCVVPKRKDVGPKGFRLRAARAANAAATPHHVVVFDESLIQATLSFSYACHHDAARVAEFFSPVPLPEVAILCTAPRDVILARNSGRAHDWGAKALECLPSVELIRDLLTERNGVWFAVNTNQSAKQITLQLIEGLRCFL